MKKRGTDSGAEKYYQTAERKGPVAYKQYFSLSLYQVAQQWRTHLPMEETRVRSLGQGDPLEEGTATQSSILAWRIPGTEEPGGKTQLND